MEQHTEENGMHGLVYGSGVALPGHQRRPGLSCSGRLPSLGLRRSHGDDGLSAPRKEKDSRWL